MNRGTGFAAHSAVTDADALTSFDHRVGNVSFPRLYRYRLQRVRHQLAALDCVGCLLFDPINIRYASGTRNMSVWTQHSPSRYLFVATDGPVVLFDSREFKHPQFRLDTVDEVRPPLAIFFEVAGSRLEENSRRWAAEIADLVAVHGSGRRLAIDRLWPAMVDPILEQQIEIVDAQRPLELARAIKSDDEIACMTASVELCEKAFIRMAKATEPGVTENRLWSELNRTNAELGGEWIETRLLSSGPRTNPWYQEASDRRIESGDLVACDSDMVGPFGYCADISRTWFCGSGRPSDMQRGLFALAVEQIEHNLALIRPGLTFREFAEKEWPIPDEFRGNRYGPVHGVGLADEYPDLNHAADFADHGYDGVIEAGMTLCIESYIGAAGGHEGVKLEEQILVTKNGAHRLSTLPYDQRLSG